MATRVSRSRPAEPSRETTVAGFPGLYVWCRPCLFRPGYALLEYNGCAADLVGAGILPRRALQIGRPRKAERRTDGHGDRYRYAECPAERRTGRFLRDVSVGAEYADR